MIFQWANYPALLAGLIILMVTLAISYCYIVTKKYPLSMSWKEYFKFTGWK